MEPSRARNMSLITMAAALYAYEGILVPNSFPLQAPLEGAFVSDSRTTAGPDRASGN
jgi:hypothetical protein